jgi:hypothetical protein
MPSLTLNILVEGDTEAEIARGFLEHYWEHRFTKCQVFNSRGSGNLKAHYVRDTKKLLSTPDQAVLVLIDIKNDPFGVQSNSADAAEAYRVLRAILYGKLGMQESDLVGIFPIVVEPETWLIADPNIQKTYLHKIYDHPETEVDPTAIIKRDIPGYRKGRGATKIFAKASAKDVYDDNCPHFKYLVDWIRGEKPTPDNSYTSKNDPQKAQEMNDLEKQFSDLTEKIEAHLRNGKNTAAGLLKTDLNYIEKQMRELAMST